MAGHGRPPLSMFSEWLHEFDGTERSASTGLHIDMPGWVSKGTQVDGPMGLCALVLCLNFCFSLLMSSCACTVGPSRGEL